MYEITTFRRIKHKKYGKYIKKRKKYIVQSSICNLNIDKNVKIRLIIPKSKMKRWEIIKN